MVKKLTLCRDLNKYRELFADAHVRYATPRIQGGQRNVHRDFVTTILNNQAILSTDRYTL